MTLTERLKEFKQIITLADSNAKHYESVKQGNYTAWSEYGTDPLIADDSNCEETIKIQIDRFTKIEFDPVVEDIKTVLDGHDITYDYLIDYETETKYIHHIFDCRYD